MVCCGYVPTDKCEDNSQCDDFWCYSSALSGGWLILDLSKVDVYRYVVDQWPSPLHLAPLPFHHLIKYIWIQKVIVIDVWFHVDDFFKIGIQLWWLDPHI